ncbi:MAG: hypothetical protein K6A43_08815 [Treponema sp.]|nr:hypothetical protein [Treponema sp.]
MNSRPLVGKNSSPHVASLFIAVLTTSIFWICFTICAFVLKPFHKNQKFETVQIVLSSTPVETKTEESKAENHENEENELAKIDESVPPVEEMIQETAVEESVQNEIALPLEETAPVTPPAPAPEKPVPQKTQETQKPVQNNTKTSAKTNETPADKKIDWNSFDYANDYSDLDSFDFSSKTTSSADDFDLNSFDKVATSSQTSNEPRKVYGESGIEGSAAQSTTTTNQRQSGGGKTQDDTTFSASDKTKGMLNNVKQSTYTSSLDNGSKSVSTVSTEKKDGKLAVAMSDGTTRVLLDPLSPSISLSSEAAATIDTDKNVKISFSVSASGNVIDIKITPESILPEKVREEIRNQLKNWKFESSSSSASASFEYTIIKK